MESGVPDAEQQGDQSALTESGNGGSVEPECVDQRGDIVGQHGHRHRSTGVGSHRRPSRVWSNDVELLCEAPQVSA
jgi:hypothetical protein